MTTFRGLPPVTADGIAVVPTVADLPTGMEEGAIRYVQDADRLYTYNGTTWINADIGIAGPTPATSTDNAVVRWDGTDASATNNSVVVINDAGNVSGVADLSMSGNLAVTGTVDGRDVATDGTAQDSHIAATAAHGATGAVVGTTNAQALTSKTIVVASNTVTTAASGNLAATELNTALAELQSDIDTRATEADLTTDEGNLATHIANTSNPHTVTATQVGLGNVDNTSNATERAASATLANKTVVVANNTITTAASGNLAATELNTALAELQSDIDTRATEADLTTDEGNLSTHIANTSNPHTVTATQVGLGNVDNTSNATERAASATLTNKTIDGNSNTLTVLAATQLSGVTPLANGGTAKALTAENGGLVWSDADSLEITTAGTAQQWVLSGGAAAPTMSSTTTTPKMVDGTTDAIQFVVQGHSTQTSDVFVVEKSDGVDLLQVTNTLGTLIKGTTTTGDAAAGCVGEHMIDTTVRSAPQAMASPTAYNLGTITLTPGDWDVGGAVSFSANAATSITTQVGCISVTSATLSGTDTIGVPIAGEFRTQKTQAAIVNQSELTLSIPTYRVTVAASTTLPLFVVGQAAFTLNGMSTYGSIWARRVR